MSRGGGDLDLETLDPMGAATDALSCAPVAHLSRDWFGGAVTATRVQDEQVLLPVGVVGQVTTLVPLLGGLLQTITQTVYGLVDVAVLAQWDEEFVTWSTYTDHLNVGLGDAELPAQLSALDAQGWKLQSLEVGCGDASQGTGLQRDPRTAEVQYFCLGCQELPSNGWIMGSILDLKVYVAEARDYAELPKSAAISACPDEVVAAVEERINELALTLEDAIAQKAQRELARAMVL